MAKLQSSTNWDEFQYPEGHSVPQLLAETLTFSCNKACLLRLFYRNMLVLISCWWEGEMDGIDLDHHRCMLTLTSVTLYCWEVQWELFL